MISIILPIYNSAPWIETCVRSVIAQTLTDWELIGVDDESSDNSVELFSSFAASDPRMRLIRATHGGLARVRNIGMKEARGEYVAFLDSDDLWPERNLEYLLSILRENDAGISCAGYLKFSDGQEATALDKCNRMLEAPDRKAVRVLTGPEALEESLYQSGVNSSAWGKLFAREVLDSITFTEGEIYEDLDFFYRIALRSNRIAVSSLPVYLYRQRAGSILHVFGTQRLDVLKVTRRMCDYLSSNCPGLLPAAIDRRFSANFNMLQEITKYLEHGDPGKEEKAVFEGSLVEINSFIRENALRELKNGKVRIKNKVGALLYLLLPSRMLRLIMKKT